MRQISPKAIAAGAAVDIIATNVVTFPLLVGVMAKLATDGLSTAQQTAALRDAFDASPGLYTTSLLVGSVCSVLGGYVAAHIARRRELLHGALSAVLCVGFGLWAWRDVAASGVGVWEHVAYAVLSPSLGAFGGAVRRRRGYADRRDPHVSADSARVPSLSRGERVLLIANRVLLALLTMVAALFIATALAHTQDRHMVLGSLLLTTLAVAAVACYVAAGRALRAGRSTHWRLHALALALTVAPVPLFV
jgi:hypothetical protein